MRSAARADAVVLLGVALLLAACKDHSAAPQPALAPSGPAAPAAPKAPALAPAPAAPPPEVQPLDDADVAAMLPRLDGEVMIAPKTTADAHQAHATWCVAGTTAIQVAGALAITMTSEKWTNLSTRGDERKAGVSGERDGYQLSYVVSASSAASCREPSHYLVSATLFRMR